jgi:GDPmannose 4,6-dehydratase
LDKLVVGNLNVKRDFGYAPKYVEAMWKMLQSDNASDFVICSGKAILLRDIVEYVFDKFSLNKSLIVENKEYFRPNEIDEIYGENSKAKKDLKWNYDISFFDVLDILLKEEIKSQI